MKITGILRLVLIAVILLSVSSFINSFFGRSKLIDRIDQIEVERETIKNRLDSTILAYQEKNKALEELISNQQQKISILNQGVADARILSQEARESLDRLNQQSDDLWDAVGGLEKLSPSNQ